MFLEYTINTFLKTQKQYSLNVIPWDE